MKVKVIATVLDTKTMEYVQRIVEFPVTNELATMLAKEFHSNQSYGYGDKDKKKDVKGLATILRDQKRFNIIPRLLIMDDEDKIIDSIDGMIEW